MGRSKKGKNHIGEGFVALTWSVLNSAAYQNLTPSSAKLLPYFLGKVKKPERNLDRYKERFSFSYPEAVKLGFSKSTFAKVLRELEEAGFITRVEKGGLRGEGKGYNKFVLSRDGEKKSEDGIGSKWSGRHESVNHVVLDSPFEATANHL